MSTQLQANRTSLERLRHMLFGAQSEKSDKVLKDRAPTAVEPGKDPAGDAPEAPFRAERYGRDRAAAYTCAQ